MAAFFGLHTPMSVVQYRGTDRYVYRSDAVAVRRAVHSNARGTVAAEGLSAALDAAGGDGGRR